MGITNDFSWSKSRASTLDMCERKYFLHYYAYWNGWLDKATPEVRRLYKTRSLSSIPAWIGTLSHKAIEFGLTQMRVDGRPPRLGTLMVYARERMAEQWDYSVNRKFLTKPKARNPQWFGLIEHALDIPLPEHTPERVLSKVYNALTNLYDSSLFQADICTSDPTRWIDIEGRAYFYLDEVRVWSAPDFTYTMPDGRIRLIDWKTGQIRAEDHMLQIAGYAAHAMLERDIPLDQIQVTLAYLSQGEPITVIDRNVTMDDIEAFAIYARGSMTTMTAKLVDGDRKANNPLPIAQFKQTTNTSTCNSCNFRDHCFPPEAAVHAQAN